MTFDTIRFEKSEQIATITLNRPENMNTYNVGMLNELLTALEETAVNEEVRAVILTGEGRAFCAGADVKGVEALISLQEVRKPSQDTLNLIVQAVLAIRQMPKPVVAAVNGVAAGAAANIALACDLVLAAENASFLEAFCHIGLIPDSGGTFFLPRLAGLQRAAAMTMLGEKIFAAQALEWGMIYKVYPAETLMEEATKLAAHLATQPTKGLGLIKRALNQSLHNTLKAQLELEAELQAVAGKTADCKEGVTAFLEKRKPKFVGK